MDQHWMILWYAIDRSLVDIFISCFMTLTSFVMLSIYSIIPIWKSGLTLLDAIVDSLAAVAIQLTVYPFRLSCHTYKFGPNLIPQQDFSIQPQLRSLQSQTTRSHHDTLMTAIMQHYSQERFTNSQIVSIMATNSRWFSKHILPFSLAKCAHSFCPHDNWRKI